MPAGGRDGVRLTACCRAARAGGAVAAPRPPRHGAGCRCGAARPAGFPPAVPAGGKARRQGNNGPRVEGAPGAEVDPGDPPRATGAPCAAGEDVSNRQRRLLVPPQWRWLPPTAATMGAPGSAVACVALVGDLGRAASRWGKDSRAVGCDTFGKGGRGCGDGLGANAVTLLVALEDPVGRWGGQSGSE